MQSLELLARELESARAACLEYRKKQIYYEEQRDREIREMYYQRISFERNSVHDLLKKTHRYELNYSPHRYVYPWVDLQEDGKLKSIYSGKRMEPLDIIEEDIRILANIARGDIAGLSNEVKLNCEHVVPQSWFQKQNPMRGDLHHLFACEPACNSLRGNYPYYDFSDYVPENLLRGIKDGCGKVDKGKFEPEYGKGIVARATMYFLIRYQSVINSDLVDLELLLKWHHQFPATRYEKHRNLAIFELQGNRNPFIDFPEMARKLIGQ